MSLPWTTSPLVPWRMSTPCEPLPEMMLPAPATLPPTVLALSQVQEDALLDVADLGEAVATEADVVALDQGRAEAVDEDARAAVARDDVAAPVAVPPIVAEALVTRMPLAVLPFAVVPVTPTTPM